MYWYGKRLPFRVWSGDKRKQRPVYIPDIFTILFDGIHFAVQELGRMFWYTKTEWRLCAYSLLQLTILLPGKLNRLQTKVGPNLFPAFSILFSTTSFTPENLLRICSLCLCTAAHLWYAIVLCLFSAVYCWWQFPARFERNADFGNANGIRIALQQVCAAIRAW